MERSNDAFRMVEEQLEKVAARANKIIEKQVDADAEELKKELDEAAK